MAPVETKLVIPDYRRNRLVQVNSLNTASANWDLYQPVLGTIYPYDIDFDYEGIIYIANFAAAPDVLRLNNIKGTSPGDITDGNINNTAAVAVDKIRDLVYYGNGNILRRSNLDGSGQSAINTGAPHNITGILGLDVDENGILYIVGTDAPGVNQLVFRYDIDNNLSSSINIQGAKDVILKGNYVYVATTDLITPAPIVRLTKDLTSRENFGIAASNKSDTSPGHFLGPMRFVAILNKRFYLIDEGGGAPDADRIIAFDAVGSWSGWDVKEGTDFPGGDTFQFYSC